MLRDVTCQPPRQTSQWTVRRRARSIVFATTHRAASWYFCFLLGVVEGRQRRLEYSRHVAAAPQPNMLLTGETRYSIRIFRGSDPFRPGHRLTSWNNIVQTGSSAGTSLASIMILTHLVDSGARRLRNFGRCPPRVAVGASHEPRGVIAAATRNGRHGIAGWYRYRGAGVSPAGLMAIAIGPSSRAS